MYLHIGEDVVIDTKDIVYISDIDRNTISKRSKEFLINAEQKGKIFYVSFEELPKTMILTIDEDGDEMIYLSPFTISLIRKKIKDKSFFEDAKCTYKKLF